MAVGALGALAQDDLKRLLSFHIVGQIGFMIFGLGLFTVAGISAVVFYIVQTILVKTNLFLVAGLIDRHTGSSRISRVGGVVRSAPIIAVFFAVPALSLAGLPPSSGFAGKFALINAGVMSSQWAIVTVCFDRQPAHLVLDDQDLGRACSGVSPSRPHRLRKGERMEVRH